MTSHTTTGGTWLGREVRGLWPDHNPLRRRCDRAGAAIAAGVLSALVLGVPAAAFAAGYWAHASGSQAMRAEEATRHQTEAVLLGNAHPARCGASMPARWAAPNGTTRTGTIATMAAPTAGNTVMVWTDGSGRLTSPPLRHAVVASRAVAAAVLGDDCLRHADVRPRIDGRVVGGPGLRTGMGGVLNTRPASRKAG